MKIEVVKEIRFAVVMYGGVSLAIYINGVAQELLRMVRATAVNVEGDEFRIKFDDLDESEKIYRELSYLLGDRKLLNKFAAQITDEQSWQKVRGELADETGAGQPAKVVRFVVDILSGSSAGGINAVYLSKALVSGQKINSLQHLWIKEGDFSSLLNDAESVKETNLMPNEEPPSLFDSRRMYWKLLEAFEKMDEEVSLEDSMLDELDLFVTTTDFWGLPIPVRLFDRLIHERNHRRRIHFKYRTKGANDFLPENYPFLAYAARCTSSFPVVFDPMKLSDTALILNTKKKGAKMSAGWKSYFPRERLKSKAARVNWENRVFVDGGTLDNKPFGYAIETLAQRQANVLIDRKLIYIEPKPDADGGVQRIGWTHRPDALKNTINIVTSLPGYETIREDLQQVLERNRLIVRVNYIVSNARKDEYMLLDLVKSEIPQIVSENPRLAESRRNKKWAELTLAELAREQGQAVYSYYRLRMSALTDDLARLATRRAGFDDASDYFLAIRSLVRVWRLKNYNKEENELCKKTIPALLYDYDFNYRLRRLRFVLQEADRLLSAADKLNGKSFADLSNEELQKDKFAADLKLQYEIAEKLENDTNFQTAIKSDGAPEVLRQRFPMIESEIFEPSSSIPGSVIFKANKDELRPMLRDFKKSLNRSLKELDRRRQLVETRGIDKDLSKQFEDLNEKFSKVATRIGVTDLADLLDDGEDKNIIGDFNLESSDERGKKFLKRETDIAQGIDAIAESIRIIFNGGTSDNAELSVAGEESLFGKVRREAETLLSPRNSAKNSPENAVRGYLWHFYKNFDNYDQIIFPITFETPIGEGDIVEVARISPADATSLIDETKGRKKLAGDTFFSFSAFFKEEWRRNDIMWGRLDAVERLVELVSTESDLSAAADCKKTIVTELHKNILRENKSLLSGDEKNYIEFVKKEYKVDRNLDEKSILKTIGRSLDVAAKVLRSPVETKDTAAAKPNRYAAMAASAIDYVRRIFAEISSEKSSLKTYLFILISLFAVGFVLIVPFSLLLVSLLWGTILIIKGVQPGGDTNSLIFGILLIAAFLATSFGWFKLYSFMRRKFKNDLTGFIKTKLTGE